MQRTDRSAFEAREPVYRAAHPDERLYAFFAAAPILVTGWAEPSA
jgi:4'-phosphopantetheinyl transferase EntD